MSAAAAPYLSPELEELLAEIASDPRSSLLRVQRPPRVRELLHAESPVRESCSLLTRAERKLVQVYREEAAWLLRTAARQLLLARAEMHQLAYAQTSANPEPIDEQPGPRGISRQLLRIGRHMSPSWEARQVSLAAHRCAFGHANPEALCALSGRIAPNESTTIIRGCHLLADGRSAEAEALFQHVLTERSAPELRVSALTWCGVLAHRAGDLDASRRHYQQACRDQDHQPPPNAVLSWLTTSVLSSRIDLALQAAQLAGELWSTPAGEIADWVTARRDETYGGRWRCPPHIARDLQSVADRVGGAASLLAAAVRVG